MNQKICLVCQSIGTKKKTPGSIFIEIILWLFFIIPGLIYSIWRLSSRKDVCKACGSETVVPTSSPAGSKILAQHMAD